MKNTSLLLLFFFLQLPLYGQTVFKGVVKTDKGVGVRDVYIMLSVKGSSTILGYASSDLDGNYNLSFTGSVDTICINVSRLDYAKQNICVPNKSQQLDFTLKSEVTQLKEVVIRPERVWRNRDTVNYSVSQFASKDDRSIGDVLRKLPGIEVSASGRVSYNGEPINKFMVEDMDLMGGQYNVVTNNLNNKYVDKVQVYENYEPKKALQENSLSDKAAINLVLKDDVKSRWLVSGKLGIGLTPLLWDNELSLMRFAKKSQGIFVYKNNNAGNNISTDLTSHYGLFSTMQKSESLGIPSSTPPLSQTNRYLFNNAHLFTANQLWKLNKDYELRLNADYLNDYQTRNNINKTTYYIDGKPEIVVDEQTHVAININKLKAGLTLTGNALSYYLNNSFRGQVDWSHTTGLVSGNEQYLESPYYNLSNDFIWLKNFKKNRIEILSNNLFNKSPQSLTIHPGLYNEIFNNGQPYEILKQTTHLVDFSTEDRIAFTRTSGHWSQNYSVGVNVKWQGLDSEIRLSNLVIPDSFKNDLTFTRTQFYIHSQISYVGKRIKTSVTSPFGYQILDMTNKVENNQNKKERFYINPRLSFGYDFNTLWNATINASYSDNYNDVNNLYTGYILTNYRSVMKNEGDFSKTESQNYNIRISYRDPIKLSNAYVSFNYSRHKFDKLFEQYFIGLNHILSVRKGIKYDNYTENKSISATVSKGFDRFVKKVLLSSSYSTSGSNQLQQGLPVVFQQNTFSTKFSLESNLASWINFIYNLNFSNSKSDLKGATLQTNYGSISRFEHKFMLNIFPVKALQLGLNMEYENSSVITKLPSAYFMDFSIKYKFKKIEFEANWSNIFNERNYVIAHYGEFFSSHNIYELRPSNFIFTMRFSL